MNLNSKRSYWLAGTAAVLLFAAGGAFAQTAPPASGEVTTTTDPKTGETRRTSTATDNGVTTSATAVSNASGQLEEVVVTANKRRENLQEVPIAVTAITAQTAAAVGVTDVSSLQTTVPGLQFPRIASGTTPALRGVGTTFGFGGQENLVALYMDDVYIASPAAATFSFNNIDQIEVLKGPQGTLFGRNALAGVINVTTRTPGASPRADISVGYANYNTLSGSFYGSTPIGDKLAADIAIMGDNQIDGWGRNLTTGKPAFTTRDLAIRSKWVYRPDDATVVTLIALLGLIVFNALETRLPLLPQPLTVMIRVGVRPEVEIAVRERLEELSDATLRGGYERQNPDLVRLWRVVRYRARRRANGLQETIAALEALEGVVELSWETVKAAS